LANHNRKGGKAGETRRLVGIIIATFLLAMVFSLLSESVLRTTTILLAFVALVSIVVIGILSDIIGLAAATADRSPLNAMAAKRVPGARQALRVIRNAPRMATIFNDLVGDICGTVSGAAGAAIVFQLGHARPTLDEGLATVVLVSLIAAATVGGKAMGKSVAIYRADEITLQVGRVMWWLEEKLGLVILADSASRRSTRRRVDSQ